MSPSAIQLSNVTQCQYRSAPRTGRPSDRATDCTWIEGGGTRSNFQKKNIANGRQSRLSTSGINVALQPVDNTACAALFASAPATTAAQWQSVSTIHNRSAYKRGRQVQETRAGGSASGKCCRQVRTSAAGKVQAKCSRQVQQSSAYKCRRY